MGGWGLETQAGLRPFWLWRVRIPFLGSPTSSTLYTYWLTDQA